MQIRPGQQVYISYLIPNPSDNTIYFPQAVVKNTQTGAIIATINLTQDSAQHLRYTGSFVSPADSVGNGYFMDSVAIPYTDSGHTTPSALYGADMVTYFAWQPPPYYGGGDAVLIDYDKVASLMDDRIKGIRFPKQKDVIIPRYPKPEKVDLSPILASMQELMGALVQVHSKIDNLPKPEQTDLSPLHNAINGVGITVGHFLTKHAENIKSLHSDSLKDMSDKMQSAHKDSLKEWSANMNKKTEDMIGDVGSRFEDLGTNGFPVTIQRAPKEKGPVQSPKEILRMLNRRS